MAGGAARAVFEGQELRAPSDVDYFSPCLEAANLVTSVAKRFTTVKKDETGNNKTITLLAEFKTPWQIQKPVPFKFQIIRSGYYENIGELFRSFDFTICQFATDGHHVIYTEQAERDLASKTLSYEPDYPIGHSRVERLLKYVNRGFTPAPGVLSKSLTEPRGGEASLTNGRIFVSHGY
ncbi:MAG: hypothetical protein EOP83_36415 [Verrucomicrobiaceae bacterium]|nr:MAG: hypothetical protein EOP83_36415 [Verrucomicrobiaceae bacterium]